ncbi:MAG: NAD(P)H-hydrate dehydratase [Candidatus Omnitrophica bacterium]|jgi:NAD(P)H-hydrate epimerase|nr:NAD(P)H-hydrate dehydratase [Candidatus Omnitrophota bacterium]
MNNTKFKIPKRIADTHKGDYGHILIVAGSAGMTGAAYLACEAAMISGCGLVTLAIPESLDAFMAVKLIEAMTMALPETSQKSLSRGAHGRIMRFCRSKASCVLIGPGVSRNNDTQYLMRRLIRDIRVPMVIDADAINALAGHLSCLDGKSDIVITPHPGEMAGLICCQSASVNKDKINVAKKFATEYNVTTVLKGHGTIVASAKGELFRNNTGNPGMASAGCGDVLSGIISALLASGMPSFEAARLGVYAHGLAGDLAAKETGEISLRARDIIRYLPRVFKKIYG